MRRFTNGIQIKFGWDMEFLQGLVGGVIAGLISGFFIGGAVATYLFRKGQSHAD